MITHFREQAKEDDTKRRHRPANIITESCAGSAQQSWKQRRQIHRKESKHALAHTDEWKPPEQSQMIARHAISAEHRKEIGEEYPNNRRAIAEQSREPPSE